MNANDIGTLIDKLAAKLSVPASHLWAILVRQAHVTVVIDVIQTVALLVIATAMVVPLRRVVAWTDEQDDLAIFGLIYIIATVAMVILTIVATVSNATEIAQAALNPEYFALHTILTSLK